MIHIPPQERALVNQLAAGSATMTLALSLGRYGFLDISKLKCTQVKSSHFTEELTEQAPLGLLSMIPIPTISWDTPQKLR